MSSVILSTAGANSDPGLAAPAMAAGGPFSLPAGRPGVLAEVLRRAADRYPEHGVFHLLDDGGVDFQSYPALLTAASRILAGLRASGLEPGRPVIFQLGDNRDFIASFWACALGGFVPVPMAIAPTYEQAHSLLTRFANAWEMLGRPLILADDSLIPRLKGFAERDGLKKFNVVSVAVLRDYPATAAWHVSRPDDLALLLLTSGSTGKPKAVCQTHGNLVSWADSAAGACAFTPADVSINWMPLDHVGGLVMFHLRDVATGCRQYHAATELVLRSPLTWLDWIDRYRATITWAPNFAFGLINEQAEEVARGHWDLSSMKFILNGGEAIVSRTARRFMELLAPHGLPATSMRPAWGMSETCSGVTYSSRFTSDTTRDSDPFVEVGEPIPGIGLRVVDPADRIVAEGEVGRLQIRGISVTPGYYDNPGENARAFTTDGWFNTGDLAVIALGRLTITGRDKDVIIINGANFYSHEIEGVVEELAGVEVSFTAACAVRTRDGNTDRVAIFFSPAATAQSRLGELMDEIRSLVSRRMGVVPDFIVPVAREEIPKTAIGKIQRSQLRERFERGDFARRPEPEQPRLYHRVWQEVAAPEPTELPVGSRVLVLMDKSGLGWEISSRLRAAGHDCITVESGADFAVIGPADFRIDPDRPEDYSGLFSALARQPGICTHLVYAFSYSPAKEPRDWPALAVEQAGGVLPLLHLAKAWPASSGSRVRLLIATSLVQSVEPGETVDFSRSPLIGMLRTLPHEFQGFEVGHLDFDGIDPANHASPALSLLAAPQAAAEMAFRNGRWLRPSLQPVASRGRQEESAAFQPGGLYVISGGLGGIGRELARYLAAHYRARLLLLGQVPLPATGDPASERDRERLAAYAELVESGAEALYAAGDIADPVFVREAVGQAVSRWQCPLSGVIHLAGVYRDSALVDESGAGFLQALRPKLGGALALHAVARDNPGSLFVNFSSVLAQFGAFGHGAYAAANAGLDAFAQYQRREGLRSFSIAWSLWSNTGGMTRQVDSDSVSAEAMRNRGYRVLKVPEAIELLEAGLRAGHCQSIAGLDPGHSALGGADGGMPGDRPKAGSADSYVAPRNELEERLARWWQELLGLPRVGVRDNFFDLGGRSILAAQLFARIDKELSRTLPIATLFKCPTVEQLAALLAQGDPSEVCRLLAVQPNGSLPPFFCIPGVGSDAIIFQDLARELGPDQPFYGLQARGLDATPMDGDLPDVEAIAAGFVAAMRKVQPEGPYFIGGHCFGSLLAWEIGRQLATQGLKVGQLVLLDPIVSNVLTDNTLGRDRLLYHWHRLRRTSIRDLARYLLEKTRNFSRTLIARQRVGRSYDMAKAMHSRYRLAPFPGRAVIFLAEDSFFAFVPERDPRRYYEKIAEGGAEYVYVPGDHHSILHGHDVIGLAEKLRACLAAGRMR